VSSSIPARSSLYCQTSLADVLTFKPNARWQMILFENIYSCRPVFPEAPLATRASNASNPALMSRMRPTSVNGIPTTSKRGRIGPKLRWAQGLSPMPSVIALVMAPKRPSSKPRVIAAQWQRSQQARTTFGSKEDSQPVIQASRKGQWPLLRGFRRRFPLAFEKSRTAFVQNAAEPVWDALFDPEDRSAPQVELLPVNVSVASIKQARPGTA